MQSLLLNKVAARCGKENKDVVRSLGALARLGCPDQSHLSPQPSSICPWVQEYPSFICAIPIGCAQPGLLNGPVL